MQDLAYKASIILNKPYDEILDIYCEQAVGFIYNFCRRNTIPTELYSVIVSMIVHDYRKRGVENVTSESKGRLKDSYTTQYPPDIINQLIGRRKIIVVGGDLDGVVK